MLRSCYAMPGFCLYWLRRPLLFCTASTTRFVLTARRFVPATSTWQPRSTSRTRRWTALSSSRPPRYNAVTCKAPRLPRQHPEVPRIEWAAIARSRLFSEITPIYSDTAPVCRDTAPIYSDTASICSDAAPDYRSCRCWMYARRLRSAARSDPLRGEIKAKRRTLRTVCTVCAANVLDSAPCPVPLYWRSRSRATPIPVQTQPVYCYARALCPSLATRALRHVRY